MASADTISRVANWPEMVFPLSHGMCGSSLHQQFLRLLVGGHPWNPNAPKPKYAAGVMASSSA